jgi:hypothetical protein
MPIGDLRVVQEEMLANLRHLALNSSDHRVRLSASKMLHDICVRREEQERSVRTVNIDALIAEIAELAPRCTLELETVDDSAEHNAGETAGTESDC